MAKAFIAVCVIALACAVSAERTFLRSLQQADCGQIKQLEGNGCQLLCTCLEVQKPKLFSSNLDFMRKLCADTCGKCVDGCKKDGKVADACKNGDKLTEGGLGACISEYSSAGKDSKKQECLRSKYSSVSAAKDKKC